MAKRPLNDDEAKRIARPGLGGGQQPQSFRPPSGHQSQLSKSSSNSEARGSVPFNHYARPQRAVVKVYIVRHLSPQKGRDSMTRHVRYLSREAVTRDLGSGRFYDAKREELDAKKETRSWELDRHTFRVILAVDNAHSLNDIKAYTREVMGRVERDLGALQWLAVNHTNTDHPHTHLLIRGKAQDGTDLVISRQYISHGIRQRAAEVATEWLGERPLEETQAAVAREARAERWTSLDGALARYAQPVSDGLQIDLKNVNVSRYALITRDLLSERLSFLKEAGLAHEVIAEKRTFVGRTPVWRLAPDFQKQLNELGARHDIIKALYSSLGSAAASIAPQVQRVQSDPRLSGKVPGVLRGVVIAKGAPNELSDERFIVVENREGKPHYVQLWANEVLDNVRVGGVLEVGRSASKNWRVAREIFRVAEHAKDGLYSTGRHRKWLEAQQPKLAAQHIEQRLRAYSLRVASFSRQADSGIARASENAVTVDRTKFEQFIGARNRWPDVRLVAPYSLSDQIQTHAYTWLDRQIHRIRLSKEISPKDIIHNAKVQAAIAQRGNWLVENGYATRKSTTDASIEFLPGAVSRLIAPEHEKFAQRCHHQFGKRVDYLREGQSVVGVYRGTDYQHRGAYALLETESAVFAAPVSKAPWAERGQRVIAKSITPKFARIEIDRGGGKQKMRGMGR